MKKKVYYRYNAETLQYEEIRSSFYKRALKYSVAVIAVALYSWVAWSFVTPADVKAYLADKSQLKDKITESNKELNELSVEICGIKERDNQLYRSMLAMGRIDESSWLGGTGGSIKNPEIAQLSDSKRLLEMAEKMQEIKHQVSLLSESQDQLISKAAKDEQKLRSIPTIRPIPFLDRPLSKLSGFGMRIDPVTKSQMQMHPGIDMGAAMGTPIFATADGVVARTEYKSNGYGLNVIVDHGYGYKTLYGHMVEIATKPGKRVKRGEIIGYVGSTGYSTAPHVHYEVFKNEERIDPAPFVTEMSIQEFKELVKSVDPNADIRPKSKGLYKRK
jgi:hypothetical protein